MAFDLIALDTRVQRRLNELEHHRYPEHWPLGGWRVAREWPAHLSRPAFADALEALNGEAAFGPTDSFATAPADAQTYWLSTEATVPDALAGRRATLLFSTEAECMVYVDGAPWQALDENRARVVLAERAEAGRTYRLDVMLFSARDRRPKALSARWVQTDEAVEAYRHTLRTVAGVARTQPADSLTGTRLWQAVDASLNRLDFHGHYGRVDVTEAARVLDEALAALRETTPPQDFDVFLVGNSHIDVTWLWTLEETRAKMGRTTATALRYLDELPDYRFAQSQPQLYEFLRQDFPDLFARVQERVAEGRWEIIGATWVEPDCNITGGEALVRQILHGQRFWQTHFGRTSDVMWLPDTFGYAWALPQILRKSGISTFVTQKLTWNNTNVFPHGHFDWEGVDGTRIRCTFPQIYVARVFPETIAQFYERYPSKHVVPSFLYLYGYGDGGGGPMREDVEIGRRLADVPGFPRCRTATAGQALTAIRAEADAVAAQTGRAVPVWKGELYLESHRGTLTTHALVKKRNRQCEVRLREAEVWASIAAARRGHPYPVEALDAAWKKVLLNQFHDIVPGTSIEAVYPGVHTRYEEVLATADAATTEALAALSAAPGGEGFTVWNSLGWTVTDYVEVDAPEAAVFHVAGPDGQPVPHQNTAGGRVGLEVTVPALGAAAFTFRAGAAPADASGGAPVAEAGSLVSQRFRVHFDAEGRVQSLYDAVLEREWMAAPGNAFQTFDDRPNQWEAWDVNDWDQEKPLALFTLEKAEVAECGPVRAVMHFVHTSAAGSRIEQDVVVYRTLPRVDFLTRVDWQERRVLLKVAFPVAVHSAHAAYEIQYGTIERPTGRNTTWEQARFEVAAHRWTDLSEGGGGVSLLNDCKYGHDIHDGVMRITLLRNPVFPDPRMPWEEFALPGREAEVVHTDTGRHDFRYAFFPHADSWRAGTVAQAHLFNSPLRVTPGAAVPEASGAVSVPGVVLEALKQAEDGDGFIVRVYEAHGARGAARVRLPFALARAHATDLMERTAPDEGPVELDADGALAFHVQPFEIRTFRVHPR